MTLNISIYERWNEFMYLLSKQPRRQIITSLLEAPEADHLPLPDAAMTPDLSVDRDAFEIKLRHIHVPLLAEARYVRWTSEPFRVRRGPRFEVPARVMEVLLAADDTLPPSIVSGCVEEQH
jgi:hypothetical protein